MSAPISVIDQILNNIRNRNQNGGGLPSPDSDNMLISDADGITGQPLVNSNTPGAGVGDADSADMSAGLITDNTNVPPSTTPANTDTSRMPTPQIKAPQPNDFVPGAIGVTQQMLNQPPPPINPAQLAPPSSAASAGGPPPPVNPAAVAQPQGPPPAVTPQQLINQSYQGMQSAPPPPKSIWRQLAASALQAAPIVGPILGRTQIPADIAYGTQGAQQLQQYLRQQGNLPGMEKLANTSVELDRNSQMAADRYQHQHAQQYEAQMKEQTDFINRDMGQFIPQGTAIPQGYFQTTSSTIDPLGMIRIAPDAATRDKLKLKERDVFTMTPALAQALPETGIPAGTALPPNIGAEVLKMATAKLANPNLQIEKSDNEVTGAVTFTAIDKRTGKVVNTVTAQGIANKRPQNININQREANDPAYLDQAADSVFQSPNTYQNLPAPLKVPVAQAFSKKYGLPAPSKISGQMLTSEEMSNRVLEQINNVNTLLKDPAVQQRLGPILGRIGNAEQTAGAAAGLTPDESQKVQRLRSALNYLIFGEGKAIFGTRVPQQLMAQFQSTSPNVKQSMPLLQGALQGATDFAGNTITAAEKARFGGRTRTGFTPGQPIQLPGQSVNGGGTTPPLQYIRKDKKGNSIGWDGKQWVPAPQQ